MPSAAMKFPIRPPDPYTGSGVHKESLIPMLNFDVRTIETVDSKGHPHKAVKIDLATKYYSWKDGAMGNYAGQSLTISEAVRKMIF